MSPLVTDAEKVIQDGASTPNTSMHAAMIILVRFCDLVQKDQNRLARIIVSQSPWD